MAYCKKCGTVLKKYIEICPLCGAPTGMEKTDDYGFYAGKAQHNGNGENADFSDSSEYRSMNAQTGDAITDEESTSLEQGNQNKEQDSGAGLPAVIQDVYQSGQNEKRRKPESDGRAFNPDDIYFYTRTEQFQKTVRKHSGQKKTVYRILLVGLFIFAGAAVYTAVSLYDFDVYGSRLVFHNMQNFRKKPLSDVAETLHRTRKCLLDSGAMNYYAPNTKVKIPHHSSGHMSGENQNVQINVSSSGTVTAVFSSPETDYIVEPFYSSGKDKKIVWKVSQTSACIARYSCDDVDPNTL